MVFEYGEMLGDRKRNMNDTSNIQRAWINAVKTRGSIDDEN